MGWRSSKNYRVRLRGENSTIKKKRQGVVPGLVVIVVGDNPASKIYVRNKERSVAAGCSEVRRDFLKALAKLNY